MVGRKRESFLSIIPIKDCYSKVAFLQQELALAKRENKIDRINSIADEIVKSEEARIAAVHRVVTNTGYRSKGLSEGNFKTNEDYRAMVERLREIVEDPTSYKATPLQRIYIPKAKGGLRPLSIPSYLDRCLQALYKLAVEPLAEESADKSSYGFRPVRNIHWAAGRTLNLLANPLANYQWVLEVDIKSCFSEISQEAIRKFTPIVPLKILDEWLNCGYIEREDPEQILRPTVKGVPQGQILSPTISNMVLDGLEDHISSNIKFLGQKGGAAMVRFADDIIFFSAKYETMLTIKELLIDFLAERGLEINTDKTKITNVNVESFMFVGFEFARVYRRNNKKNSAYIKLPKKAIDNFRNKIKRIYKEERLLTHFIDESNKVIRGWANNYRFTHDFRYIVRGLAYWLWKLFYKKAYKMTKNIHDKWNHEQINSHVLSKYFKRVGEGANTWPCVVDSSGKPHLLVNPRDVGSINPIYTNSAQNAFIPVERSKLEAKTLAMSNKHRAKVLERWQCCCGNCGANLNTHGIPYEIHHIKPRVYGGKNDPKNLVPLCREPCHLLISLAVQRKDKEQIMDFIEKNLLILPYEVLEKILSK